MQSSIFDSFEQEVATEGYQWVATEDCLVLLPKSPGGASRKYRPFSRPYAGLFRDFAQLPADQNAVLAFANEFGMLGEPVARVFRNGQLTDETTQGAAFGKRVGADQLQGSAQLGEPLEFTDPQTLEAGRRRRRLAQVLPDAHSWSWSGQASQMAALLSPNGLHFEALSDKNVQDLVGEITRTVVDKVLAATVAPRLLWLPERGEFRFQLAPRSLIGALWLQVAMALADKKEFRECAVCKRAMEISRDSTGTRIDTVFCSSKCKSQDYRNRKAKARKLAARKGWTPARIAKSLRSDAKTIRRWIGND